MSRPFLSSIAAVAGTDYLKLVSNPAPKVEDTSLNWTRTFYRTKFGDMDSDAPPTSNPEGRQATVVQRLNNEADIATFCFVSSIGSPDERERAYRAIAAMQRQDRFDTDVDEVREKDLSGSVVTVRTEKNTHFLPTSGNGVSPMLFSGCDLEYAAAAQALAWVCHGLIFTAHVSVYGEYFLPHKAPYKHHAMRSINQVAREIAGNLNSPGGLLQELVMERRHSAPTWF